MDYLIVCFVALVGSGLTLFSGFGLGTLLLPVFALFFPVDIAISLTAIVHFLNNLFKLVLIGGHADKKVVIRFGIPSVIAAFLGAYVLVLLSEMNPWFEYTLAGKTFEVLPVKLVIASVLLFFALFEIIPKLAGMQFERKYLPVGGFLSGFFGGLSGLQGALRSAFLLRAGMDKLAFIATGVVIACLVDISRLSIYARQIIDTQEKFNYPLIITAVLSAFAGAYIGSRLIKKITISTIQRIVALMLLVFSILLALGII